MNNSETREHVPYADVPVDFMKRAEPPLSKRGGERVELQETLLHGLIDHPDQWFEVNVTHRTYLRKHGAEVVTRTETRDVAGNKIRSQHCYARWPKEKNGGRRARAPRR